MALSPTFSLSCISSFHNSVAPLQFVLGLGHGAAAPAPPHFVPPSPVLEEPSPYVPPQHWGGVPPPVRPVSGAGAGYPDIPPSGW